MHRISLQRVDRCSMRHQVEMREPFLDPSVVRYALGLDAGALVQDVNGSRAARRRCAISTISIPTCCRGRSVTGPRFRSGRVQGSTSHHRNRRGNAASTMSFRIAISSKDAWNSPSSTSSRKRNCFTFEASRTRSTYRAYLICATARGFPSRSSKIKKN